MHRQDYEDLAGAVRSGVEAAEWSAKAGGTLAALSAEQVRQVAAVLIGEMAGALAEVHHNFNADAWLAECGLIAEVTATRPAPVRQFGAPLDFGHVRVGDWIEYAATPGYPIVGRVRRCTDKVVRTEHDRSVSPKVEWPEGRELRRSQWGSLHVRLVDPAAAAVEVPAEAPPVAVKPARVQWAEVAQRAMEAARAFLAREGHLRVPAKHVEGGYRLGGWVASQRYEYRHHCLNPDRLRELDALHVSWRHGITDGGAKV